MESVRTKTPPQLTLSAANVSSVGNSQKDKGDTKQQPVITSSQNVVAPPAYGLSGRRRKPGENEEPAPKITPASSDM